MMIWFTILFLNRLKPVRKRDDIEDWDVATISSFSLSQVLHLVLNDIIVDINIGGDAGDGYKEDDAQHLLKCSFICSWGSIVCRRCPDKMLTASGLWNFCPLLLKPPRLLFGVPRYQVPSARWYQVPGLTLHGFCTYLAPFYPPSLIIGSGSWKAWRIFIKIWPVGRHCAAH